MTTPPSFAYPGDDDTYLQAAYFMPLAETWNGAGSAPGFLTGIDDDLYPAFSLRNRGAGPAFHAQDSAGDSLMTLTDTGTELTNLYGTGTATVDGDTLLNALLSVIGAGTFGSTLDVTGAGTFSDTLHGAGAATFGDTLGVTGAGTFASTLAVTGAATFGAALHATGAATFDATLHVTGAATFDTTLHATGAGTFDATLGVTGAATVGATLGVTGAATFGATLDVTGALVARGPVTLGDAAADLVTVAGTATFAEDLTLVKGLIVDIQDLVVDELTHRVGIGGVLPSRPLHVVQAGAIMQALAAGSTVDDVIVADGPTATVNVVYAGAYGGLSISTTAVRKARLWWEDATNTLRLHPEAATHALGLGAAGQAVALGQAGGKVGVLGAAPVVQQAVVAAATDLPTVIALANNLRATLRTYGWFA